MAAALALAVASVPPQYLADNSWLRVSLTLPGVGSFSGAVGQLLVAALAWLPFALLMPLVSYRRRDWMLVAFVPVYGWVVAARVGWRLAHLPERDWYLRPEEHPRTSADTSRDPDGLDERRIR